MADETPDPEIRPMGSSTTKGQVSSAEPNELAQGVRTRADRQLRIRLQERMTTLKPPQVKK